MYGLIVGGACALVVALLLILGPSTAALAVVGCGILAILALRPSWSLYATIIVGLTAFPALIPYSIQIGSTTVFLFEPFLFMAALWAVSTHPAIRGIQLRILSLGAVIAAAALAGIASQHPTIEVIGDGRGLLTVTLAAVVASRLYRTPYQEKCLRLLKYSLWVSLGVIALSMVFKFKLAGRTEAASLFLNSSGAGSSESTRFLTAASEISVLVLCATLALLLTGRAPWKGLAPYLIPALLMTFLSFSRNSFLAVAMALVVALFIARTMKPLAVVGKIVAISAMPVLILVLAHLSFGLPGGDFVAAQIDGFMSRVIGGLDASTLQDDTSAIARMNEDAYLLAAIKDAPLTGHGFGYAYRPAVGAPGTFSATKGQYYGHNFYLWLTTKTGLLGLFVFLFVALGPVLRCLRVRSSANIALGAAGAGLLLSIAFAPFPNDVGNGGSLAVGILLGALIAGTGAKSAQDFSITQAEDLNFEVAQPKGKKRSVETSPREVRGLRGSVTPFL